MADHSVFSALYQNPGITIKELADVTRLDVYDVVAIVGEWAVYGIVTTDTSTITHITRVWYDGGKK
jgi:DNA-binding MarR family transcriptional regulator